MGQAMDRPISDVTSRRRIGTTQTTPAIPIPFSITVLTRSMDATLSRKLLDGLGLRYLRDVAWARGGHAAPIPRG
jgi:hypothetical protein